VSRGHHHARLQAAGKPSVRSEKILECVEGAAARRCAGFEKVVVAVDGTSLRVTDVKESKGIGWVGSLSHGARGST
jgi:hypothetical protein